MAKVTVRQRNEIWYVDFAYRDPSGVRRRFKRSTGTSVTRKEALALGRQWKRQAEAGEFVAIAQPARPVFDNQQKAEFPFSGFADHFLETYARPRNSTSEVIGKESIIRNHLAPFFKHTDIREITREDIERFIAKKVKDGLDPKTVNNYRACLLTMFNRAVDWNYLDKNPVVGVKPLKTAPSAFDFYDEAQMGTYLEAMRRHEPAWYPFFLAAFLTGMRLGELLALQWGDIDFKSGTILVRRNYVCKEFKPPKSGKSREIPMHLELAAVLKSHRHLKGDLVFSRADGTPFDQDHVRPVHERVTKLSGLRRIRFHEIRHSFASQLAMNSVPLKAIQELLGHADLAMTLRYSHLSPNVYRDAIATLMSEAVGHKSGPKNGPTDHFEAISAVIS